MRALTQKCNKIDLSMTYDGLTIYPKFDLGSDPELSLAINKCGKLDLVVVPAKFTQDGQSLNDGCQIIEKKDFYEFNRYIHSDDDDHALYHKDNFSQNSNHYHLKLKHLLTPARCKQILDIFVSYHVISPEEHVAFLQQLTARYAMATTQLKDSLTANKDRDLTIITKFIKSCGDNDILSQIHLYLSRRDFDYLRFENSAESKWQGMGQNQIGPTSFVWAMIEKGFTLQMAKNIEENTKYTQRVAEERAKQLSEDQPFFEIKRKTKFSTFSKSNIYNAFKSADEKKLDASYNHHMSRFSR